MALVTLLYAGWCGGKYAEECRKVPYSESSSTSSPPRLTLAAVSACPAPIPAPVSLPNISSSTEGKHRKAAQTR